MFFWNSTGHESQRENQISAWNRCCLWSPYAHQGTVSNKLKTSWALGTFKPMYRTTFKTPRGKLQILLKMELVTDVTLLFLEKTLFRVNMKKHSLPQKLLI